MMRLANTYLEIRVAYLFCGIGGGAKGFRRATAKVGGLSARFRNLGGIDSDPAAIRDFERLAGCRGTVKDLMDREQFLAFHGHEPKDDWREATPSDIRRAFGDEHPHILFLSAPCKGFSGLLSENKSRSERYQALNRLTLRGVWLALEAYKDDPIELILFENVPRIATRGRQLLDQIGALLRHHGYASAETTHDCGELGNLAQSRKRFLLVARHRERAPSFLYQPARRPLRAVGDVLGRMPLPGDLRRGGAMHRVPSLQWKTWIRLAMVEAGDDWRSLSKLSVRDDGFLADYGIVPNCNWQGGVFGVLPWDKPSGTITGRSSPTTGTFSVADPRLPGSQDYGQYGVLKWDESSGTLTSKSRSGTGSFSVADPRLSDKPGRHFNLFKVIAFDAPANTITGATRPGSGAMSVADPRTHGQGFGKYLVTSYNDPAGTVLAGSTTGQGAFAVADPRIWPEGREHYAGGGHYGVSRWEEPSSAVIGHAKHDRGPWAVADPRPVSGETPAMPAPTDRLVAVIQALDGTWHRPFTTLELAALQGLVDPEEQLELAGLSDQAWRERIGNAVPPPTARAIAEVMGEVLLLAWSGERFTMSQQPIWVRPVVAAVSVDDRETAS